jgi:hypothetical protein
MGRFWLLPQGQGSSSSSRTIAPSAFSFIRSFFLSSDTNSSPLLNHLHLPSSTHCHVLCLRTCHNSVIEPSAVRYISTAYTPRYYLVDSGVASAYRQGERIRERGEQANRSKLIAISPHAGQRFLVSALNCSRPPDRSRHRINCSNIACIDFHSSPLHIHLDPLDDSHPSTVITNASCELLTWITCPTVSPL